MISEKLLLEVFENKCKPMYETNGILYYMNNEFQSDVVGYMMTQRNINIYELAHMCKMWAYNLDEYVVESGLANGDSYVNVFGRYACSEDFPLFQSSKDTEPESIFAGCKWILEQKESK